MNLGGPFLSCSCICPVPPTSDFVNTLQIVLLRLEILHSTLISLESFHYVYRVCIYTPLRGYQLCCKFLFIPYCLFRDATNPISPQAIALAAS